MLSVRPNVFRSNTPPRRAITMGFGSGSRLAPCWCVIIAQLFHPLATLDDMAGSSLPSRQQSFGASFGSFDPSQDDLGGSSVPHQPQRLEAGLGSFDTTQADGVFDNGVQGNHTVCHSEV